MIGADMMLKSLGLTPEKIKEYGAPVIAAIENLRDRLAATEIGLARVECQNAEILALLKMRNTGENDNGRSDPRN